MGRLEVRWTPYHTGHLVIRPDDRADRAYALVTGTVAANDHVIRGWGWAHKLRQPEFLRDPNGLGLPAWFVPASALRSASELVEAAITYRACHAFAASFSRALAEA